jgi:hypothetical protein
MSVSIPPNQKVDVDQFSVNNPLSIDNPIGGEAKKEDDATFKVQSDTSGMSISRPETIGKKSRTEPKQNGGPRECLVSVRILSLSNLDQGKNTYDCELIMFLLWEDESLTPGEDIDWSSVWSPNVTISNCMEVRPDHFSNGKDAPKLIKLPGWASHRVLHVQKLYATLAHRYNLTQFPFDTQVSEERSIPDCQFTCVHACRFFTSCFGRKRTCRRLL